MKIEEKLKAKGLAITEQPFGASAIEPAVRTGNLIYTSGQTSDNHRGKVGRDLTVEEAYEGARDCLLDALGAAKSLIGDLDNITRVVKVLGMVNCAEGFYNTPAVIHGCSDLLLELFGENGRHARSAIGVYQLPGNVAVEIEIIFEVAD